MKRSPIKTSCLDWQLEQCGAKTGSLKNVVECRDWILATIPTASVVVRDYNISIGFLAGVQRSNDETAMALPQTRDGPPSEHAL